MTKQPFLSSLPISLQSPCLRPKPSKVKTFPFPCLHFTIKLTSRSLLRKPQLPPGPALPHSTLPGPPIWVSREEPAPDLARLLLPKECWQHTPAVSKPVPCSPAGAHLLELWDSGERKMEEKRDGRLLSFTEKVAT